MAKDDSKYQRVVLVDVRLSYPHLDQPDSYDDDPDRAKYSASFILDEDSPHYEQNLTNIRKAMKAAAIAKWGKIPAKLRKQDSALRRLDEDDEHHPGAYYVKASRKADFGPPAILDRVKDKDGKFKPLDIAKDGRPYAGCYVNASLRVYGFEMRGKGMFVLASLDAVQFRRDGEAFAQDRNYDEDFEGLNDDIEEDITLGDDGAEEDGAADDW